MWEGEKACKRYSAQIKTLLAGRFTDHNSHYQLISSRTPTHMRSAHLLYWPYLLLRDWNSCNLSQCDRSSIQWVLETLCLHTSRYTYFSWNLAATIMKQKWFYLQCYFPGRTYSRFGFGIHGQYQWAQFHGLPPLDLTHYTFLLLGVWPCLRSTAEILILQYRQITTRTYIRISVMKAWSCR